MSVMAIDIGSTHVTVLEGVVKKDCVEVHQAVTAEIPSEASGDIATSAGFVYDTLSGVLKNFKFKTKNAAVTVNIDNVLIRDFVLPDAPLKQLTGMVRNEMVQNYSAAPTDVIQYVKQPAPGAEPGTGAKSKKDAQTGIRAVTVKRETIDVYYTMIKRLKLSPLAMDFHANAVEKLILNNTNINGSNLTNRDYLLVDFGSS